MNKIQNVHMAMQIQAIMVLRTWGLHVSKTYIPP